MTDTAERIDDHDTTMRRTIGMWTTKPPASTDPAAVTEETRLKNTTAFCCSIAAFAVGACVTHLAPVAFAQTPPLQPQIIDVAALDGEALGPIRPGTELRSKTLVTTDGGTIAVQQGNVGKHYHAANDEIQYILSGTGTMWLGDTQRSIKAGDLIVVPKGVAHAGTIATSGTFKAIAIKLPPQGADDTHFLQ